MPVLFRVIVLYLVGRMPHLPSIKHVTLPNS